MASFEIAALEIPDVKCIIPRRFSDPRGFFTETWNRKAFVEAGIDVNFVQDNHSYSRARGTIRGLHFQRSPSEQAKLVRVVRGSVFDVAVDIRADSPTYRKHVRMILTAERGEQLFIPVGFAHGFCTLEPDTEVVYKVSDYYSPKDDAGIIWDDPTLKIDWPLDGRNPILSDKDAKLSRFGDIV